MSNLTRFKLARIFTSSPYWVPTIVLYYASRGFEMGEVYRLLSFYSIFIVLFEYPTGVIGDYFSHKLSVTVGYLIMSLGLLALMIPAPGTFYYLFLAVLALGTSLASGSDVALLHSLSSNFKKDSVNLEATIRFWLIIVFAIGGFVSKWGLWVPVLMSGVSVFIGFLTMSTVWVEKPGSSTSLATGKGNIFSKAAEGLSFVKTSKKVVGILGLTALVSVLLLNFKWVYTPVFQKLGIEVSAWGVAIGLLTSIVILGSLVYKKLSTVNTFILILAVASSLGLVSTTGPLWVVVLGLLVLHFGVGFAQSKLLVDINLHTKDSVRASVLSLSSLISRALSSLFLLFIGFVLDIADVSYLFMYTGVLFLVFGSLFYFGFLHNVKNERN